MVKFVELREKSGEIPVIGKKEEYNVFYLNVYDIVSLRKYENSPFTEVFTRQGVRYNVVESVECILEAID